MDNSRTVRVIRNFILGSILLGNCWGCGKPNLPNLPENSTSPSSPVQQLENNNSPAPTESNSTLEKSASQSNEVEQSKKDTANKEDNSKNVSPEKADKDVTTSTSTNQKNVAVVPQNTVSNSDNSTSANPKVTTQKVSAKDSVATMPTPSIIPNSDIKPVNFWEATSETTLRKGNPGDASWEVFSEPFCNYTFEMPKSWNIGKAKGFATNCRLMWKAGQEISQANQTRMMIIPWSIYNQKLNDEIKKAEVSWFFSPLLIQSASLTGQEQLKISNNLAIRNTYSVIPLSKDKSEVTEMKLIATYIDIKPNCYAVIMASPISEANNNMEIYKKLVTSIKVSDIPVLENEPPLPDRAPKDQAPKGEFPQGSVFKADMPLPTITTAPPKELSSENNKK